MTDTVPATVETREPLVQCPFCGRKAIIEEFCDGDDPQPLFVITCEVCPVKTYDQFSIQEAARIWNTRANSHAALLRERQVLRKAIETEAARRAYNAGLGVSEWEAFLWPEARAALGDQQQ
jgi:hypothetical protein